jgi:hypothetical protein
VPAGGRPRFVTCARLGKDVPCQPFTEMNAPLTHSQIQETPSTSDAARGIPGASISMQAHFHLVGDAKSVSLHWHRTICEMADGVPQDDSYLHKNSRTHTTFIPQLVNDVMRQGVSAY